MKSSLLTRLIAAFPAECSPDVAAVFKILSPGDHEPSSHDIAPITLRGETIRIPARIYIPEPTQGSQAGLTDRQRLIVSCLFSRHHNGFLRERMVQPLLLQTTFWTVPFVLQLLGEYVIEIILLLKERIPPESKLLYAEFLQENPKFWTLTRSRIASYWSCYYRHPFPDFHQYSGQMLFSTLEGWRIEHLKSANPRNGCRPVNKQVEIEEFDPRKHSVDEITELLHKSYKKLLDMELHFWATTQSSEVTLKRLTSGIGFVAIIDQRIVGTISYHDERPNNECAWYQKPNVSRFGQFAVDPALQNQGIGALLISHLERLAKSRQKEELSLDTSEKALHLISYYENKGFRHIDFIQWDRVNYRSVIMSKKV